MKFITGKIFTRLGKQFKTNLEILSKDRYSQPCDVLNIPKRYNTRLSKPNLYVGQTKEKDTFKTIKNIGAYGYFLLSIPIGTFILGTWQVQRRKWKLNLIETLNKRISSQPIELPADLKELESMEYCPITVKGTFLYDKEFSIGPRSLILDGDSNTYGSVMGNQSSQRGYYLITPFKLYDRDLTILVNRGWIPNSLKNPTTRKNSQIKDEVEITGILRLNEPRPQFVPKHSPNTDIWYYRDLNAMAEKADAAPVYIEMTRNKDFPTYPVGGQTRVNLRNEHLSYIVTWYSLSAFTAYMWFKVVIRKLPLA